MKQSRKEFIKKAHESACSEWKTNIEKEFPELFKEDALVVGKWYKWTGDQIGIGVLGEKCKFHKDSYKLSYFIGEGSYTSCSSKYLEPATDKEVEQALIKEAKKRGFKEGVVANQKPAYNGHGGTFNINKSNFEYSHFTQNLTIDGFGIYNYGKWAEIIKETITKEQAEEARKVLAQYNEQ